MRREPRRFAAVPAHVETVIERHRVHNERLLGVTQAWAMPAALWCSSGFDSTTAPDHYPHHTIAVALGGGEIARVSRRGGVIERASDGHFCLEPPQMAMRFVARSYVRFAHLYFTAELVQDVARDRFGDAAADRLDVFPLRKLVRGDQGLRAQIDEYLARAFGPERPLRMEMDARATLLVLDLLARHSAFGPGRAARPSKLSRSQLHAAREAMAAVLDRDVSLAEIAAAVGLPPHVFHDAFRRTTGETPEDWMNARRAELTASKKDPKKGSTHPW